MTRSNALRKTNVTNLQSVSARRFGTSVGKGDASNVEDSEALHRQFKGSDKSEQNTMRKNFAIGYLMGRLGVDETKAETYFKTPREKCKADVANAKMGASQKFLYLIARTGSKAKGGKGIGRGKGKRVNVTLTPAIRTIADKLVTQFTGKTMEDQVRKAKAALDKLLAEANEQAKSAE